MAISSNIYFSKSEKEKAIIKSIWRLSDDNLHNRREIILPKGTVEIIFNFSDKIYYFNPSFHVTKILPTVFINGVNFKPFELIKTGRQEFLGIQLNSIGLRLLFNLSAKELNNIVCNGNEVYPQLDSLANELYLKKDFAQQVQIILLWIRKKLEYRNFEYYINRTQKLLNNCLNFDIKIKKLSQEVCLSERQLRRFSNDWLGMNTEEFILYSKYLNCLHQLHNSNQSLTEIGLQSGYYDQSHFIREFKSYTGMTPRQYRAANADFPGHILLNG